MEPRLLRHGNTIPSESIVKKAIEASMEPRLLRHGNQRRQFTRRLRLNASMEPRLLRHGNGSHFRPLPACDFFSICEHLPIWLQITFQISRFECCFHIAPALRAPLGISAIQGVLAKDLIFRSFDYSLAPFLCYLNFSVHPSSDL